MLPVAPVEEPMTEMRLQSTEIVWQEEWSSTRAVVSVAS